MLLYFATTTRIVEMSYFMMEGTHGNYMKTYKEAFWFGVVTLTSVGYGDALIFSGIGRIQTMFFSIFSLCFVSLLVFGIE